MDETGAKITELSSILGADVAGSDLLTLVDISDTTMATSGTNKKITVEELLYRRQIDASSETSTTYGSLTGLVDGSNKSYTVSQGGYISGSLEVYLNGQLQTQGSSEDWTETTPASGTFSFVTAPETGDIIIVKYRY